MGMTTKRGRYFANPALGRAHERAEGSSRDGREGRTEVGRDNSAEEREDDVKTGAHSVHIFHGEGGQHHVVAHHADGPEFTEHDSLDEAMNHAKRAMSDQPGEDEDRGEGEGESGYGPSALETTL